jgi:hypothetical protein
LLELHLSLVGPNLQKKCRPWLYKYRTRNVKQEVKGCEFIIKHVDQQRPSSDIQSRHPPTVGNSNKPRMSARWLLHPRNAGSLDSFS